MKKIFIFMIMLLIALPGIAQHFSTVWTGSGYSHCNINILEAKLSGVNLEVGDEIAAFDGSICVGVVRITGSYTTLSIAASKAEPAGSGNGYTEGHPIILKYWDNSWNNNTGKEVTAIIKNDAGNDYTPTFVAGGSVFVNLSGKTELTITFGANNKTYDGDVLATVPSETVTALGVVTGQNVNVAVSNARFDTKEVGTGKTVTADVALSGTDAGYYTVSTTATTTANIVGKVITITPDANQHKVYGTTDPGLTYTASPALISPDVITGSLGRVTNENAGTYAFTMGSLSAGSNYTLQFVNTPATFTVEKRPATWTTNNNSKTYGESDPNPLTTGSGNFLGSDGVSATYTRVSGETVSGGPYAITATLASSVANALDNYTITNAGASFTINKVNSSITATGSTSYTYNASAQGPASSTVTGSTGSVTYSYSGTGNTSYSASSTAPTNAGTYQVIASVAEDANFNAATSAALAFTINKASSSITATGTTSYTYTASTQGPATSTVTGSTGTVTYSYSGVSPTVYNSSSTAPTNAGTYQVIASVVADANFNAATSEGLAFTINKAQLTVTADSKSKTYDGTAYNMFTSTIAGFVNGELVGDIVSGTVTYSGTAIAAVNAGHYTIVPIVAGLSATNYSFEAINGELTINSPSSGGGGGGSSDTTPPVWITASASLDRTIEYGDATGLAAAQALKPVASDASSFVLTKVSGSFVQSPDCIYAGTYTNTWTAKDSYGNISKVFTQVINIDKTYNEQPKIDQVNDFYVYKNCKEAEVSLSGIDPTSGCIPQEIVSLVAVSDNSSLITNILVVYEKGSISGKLVLKIADNLEGESLIKVTLRDNGGVASGASDTKDMMFKIKVVGEDQGPKLTSEIPVQIVNPGNSFQSNLNDFFEANDGKPFTYTATLANGSSLPSWMVFNPQTGIISGVAPQNDLGSYQIFVTVRDIHGLTNQTSFWMVNSTSGSYMVSGSISSKAGPVTGGIQVILLKIGDNNQTTIVEKINLNGSSSFVFSNLSSGNYLLNAVVTDVNKHPDLLNTYYNGSNSVYTAQRIELKSNSEIQLLMLNKEVFTGNGSISGLVIRKTGPAASGSTQTGVSAPDVDIVLKRDGKVVANTLTDIDGKYSFNSLPEGNYVVEVEQLGYVLDVNQKVIIAANNQSVENVNFTIWMTGAIITEVKDLISGTEISMFPNPTSGQLHIVSSKETKATVSIMNSAGVEIFHENYISGTKIDIDLSTYISGLYIVKFESDGESVVRKIVLKK